MMNAHFAAAAPNLRIMEIDVDRLPWDDELFTTVPKIEKRPVRMKTSCRRAARAEPPNWKPARHPPGTLRNRNIRRIRIETDARTTARIE